MTEAVKQLGELADGLIDFAKDHRDALQREPTVRHLLDEAAKEARRRYNVKGEQPKEHVDGKR